MPRATVASRELKNKDTGLDLFIPTYKEEKGRLSSTVYYQVVVVTNLSFFKTPSHKETDVVQCSCAKKWADFEELRIKVSEAFPGTVIPAIDKKSFIVNDAVLRDRRNSLEAFVKFLASVSKLAASPALLQFLGVDAVRANRSKHEQLAEERKSKEGDTNDEEKENKEDEPAENVFGETEDQQDDNDLFGGDDTNQIAGLAADRSAGDGGSFSMFEAQDMKPDISEEDEKNLNFVPDAIITKREKIIIAGKEEGNEEDKEKDELFRIEDDLDQLMVVDVKKSEKSSKPAVPTKPKPSKKPGIPSKPSPVSKPVAAAAAVDTMQQDDLLAYLNDNLTSNTEDVDLFS